MLTQQYGIYFGALVAIAKYLVIYQFMDNCVVLSTANFCFLNQNLQNFWGYRNLKHHALRLSLIYCIHGKNTYLQLFQWYFRPNILLNYFENCAIKTLVKLSGVLTLLSLIINFLIFWLLVVKIGKCQVNSGKILSFPCRFESFKQRLL